MKKNTLQTALLLLTVALSHLQTYAQTTATWNTIFNSGTLNQTGTTTFNYIEFDSNDTLYLLSSELPDFSESYMSVKKLSGTSWINVGQRLVREAANNENHIDFVIAPNNTMYIGLKDSIWQYNPSTNQWDATYVPEYFGGLYADSANTIYFIHRTEGTGGMASSNLYLATFNNGTTDTITPIALNISMIPRRVNTSNKIVIKNNQIHVSAVAQSTNYLFVFRGTASAGFTRLEASATIPTINAELGLSSMAVSDDGKILVSSKKGSHLVIHQYVDSNDTWILFDTAGINSISCNHQVMKYNKNGELHLIYNGSNGTGFIFRLIATGWQHIGDKNGIGLQSVNSPNMAFDSENTLHIVSGIGSSGVPLVVRRSVTVISSLQNHTSLTSKFTAFPNPANTHINLMGDLIGKQVVLTDITGRILSSEYTTNNHLLIHTDEFPNGIYFIRISGNDLTETIRISINH